jgi:hypothetical protein
VRPIPGESDADVADVVLALRSVGKLLARLGVIEGPEAQRPLEGSWILRGTTSNSRYTNREELKALSVKEEMLLRPQATRAALMIRKTAAWWDLAQDERRAIFEEQSRHIGIGMEYLPAVANSISL